MSAESLTPMAGNTLDWLPGQYAQMVAALGDMGFSERHGVPPYELIRDAVGPHAGWLATRAAAGHHDELVIAPSVHAIGLEGSRYRPGLIRRFDRKQCLPTQVRGPIAQRKDRGVIHDNGAREAFPVAILLGDVHAPGHPDRPVNEKDEPGLVYTGMTVADQRTALLNEEERHAAHGRLIASITIGQIVMVNASRRRDGMPMLDGPTYTRLVHYHYAKARAVPRVDAYAPCVPKVDLSKTKLMLQASRAEVASPVVVPHPTKPAV